MRDDDLERRSYRKGNHSGRSSASKDAKQRAKRTRKRIILFTVEGVFLFFVFITAFGYSKWRKIVREPVQEEHQTTNSVAPEVEEQLKGYTNIALFGVDARDNKTLGKGTHADVDMICSINNDTGEIRLVSVYRDTYLSITENNTFNKITQAYFNGGPSQAVGALNKNLDLNIQDYVTVNWKAVADVVNILGGIDVEITKSEFAYINGFITETVESTGVASVHLKSAGMNHLDGVQAVSYARLRLMDTDYQRTERQRLVIQLTMEKAKQADLATLLHIVDVVFPQVQTSLDFNEVLSLTKNIMNYHIGATTGFPFDKQSKMMGKKGDCVIPLGLEQNVNQLHAFLFGGEIYAASETVVKLDQMLKDATGLHNPGNNSSSYVSGTAGATAAPTVTATSSAGTEKDNEELGESNEHSETKIDPTETSPQESGNENGSETTSHSSEESASGSNGPNPIIATTSGSSSGSGSGTTTIPETSVPASGPGGGTTAVPETTAPASSSGSETRATVIPPTTSALELNPMAN